MFFEEYVRLLPDWIKRALGTIGVPHKCSPPLAALFTVICLEIAVQNASPVL